MKQLLKSLFAVPLLIGSFAGAANAATVTRTITTTTQQQCRDFTKTTTYVDHVESSQGTACLYPDGAWHVVSSDDAPIIQDQPTYIVRERVINQPVYYTDPVVFSVPVYRRPGVIYDRRPYYSNWDHPHHYDRGYGRDDVGYDLNIRGRL